jgi:hypothetical protein
MPSVMAADAMALSGSSQIIAGGVRSDGQIVSWNCSRSRSTVSHEEEGEKACNVLEAGWIEGRSNNSQLPK